MIDLVSRLSTGARVLDAGCGDGRLFTDRLDPPDDLAPFMRGLFREGELEKLYADWELERSEAYTLDDEHPGGIRHRHPVNEIVARRRG